MSFIVVTYFRWFKKSFDVNAENCAKLNLTNSLESPCGRRRFKW